MRYETRNIGKQDGNGGFKSRRRRFEIFVFAEVADDIYHTNFADAAAIVMIRITGGGGGGGGADGVIAGPDADELVIGGFNSGESVGDGGGNWKGLQWRLAKAEVSYLIG